MLKKKKKTVPSYHLHYFPPSPSPTSNSGRSSNTLRTWIRSDLTRTTAQVSEDQWPGQMSCKERLSLKTFSYFNVVVFSENLEKTRGDSLSNQHLHCVHHRKLPHDKDHSKCLGDCPEVIKRLNLALLVLE